MSKRIDSYNYINITLKKIALKRLVEIFVNHTFSIYIEAHYANMQ